MLELLPLLAAAVIASPPVTATANLPLRLEVHQAAGKNVIEVVGESPVACSASYRLQVSDTRGGNRSVTAGTATIAPGVRHTFATVALGPESNSVAKLDVSPCGGAPYQQAWPNGR